MKVNRTQAVEFFIALGMPKADDWDREKLQNMLEKTSDKVKKEDCPKGFEELYGNLCKAHSGSIEVSNPLEKTSKKKAPAPKVKPSTKPAAKKKVVAKKAPKAKVKPAAKKATKKPAAKSIARKDAEGKDQFGNRVDTMSATVNTAMLKSGKWMTIEEVAKASGIEVAQARTRLYHARKGGWVEYQRIVQYRIVPKKG